MRRESILRQFPYLLGRFPRTAVSVLNFLASASRLYMWELLIAVPFIGLFIVLIVSVWSTFALLHAVLGGGILLFIFYLVLVLMVRQHCGGSVEDQQHSPY
jgi:hypothetical protein